MVSYQINVYGRVQGLAFVGLPSRQQNAITSVVGYGTKQMARLKWRFRVNRLLLIVF